ncbi:MAG TPA: hypothetical protein VLW85_03880 [Myxococcales bacterium]|nr:hypothetical protein [Myxococcales bacterium]
MRSGLSAFALAAVCACGNLSNEDLAFLEALPQKDQLHVAVPVAGTSQNLCTLGAADVWTSAKSTGDDINAGVEGILALVDQIRAVTPTTRDTDSRAWGPFPDSSHPGYIVQVTMSRELDAQGVPWRWIYDIEERKPPADFLPILEGEFFGAQARDGIGRITLHFENTTALGINKPTDPTFPAQVLYDLSSDPHTVALDLTNGVTGFGLVGFYYGYAGYADGHGRFDYTFPDQQSPGCNVQVTAYFTAQGAGRATFTVHCPLGLSFGPVTQCWDVSACIVYADDPFALTPACGGVKPCLLGAQSSCAL